MEFVFSLIASLIAITQLTLLMKFDNYILWPMKVKYVVYVLMILTLIGREYVTQQTASTAFFTVTSIGLISRRCCSICTS